MVTKLFRKAQTMMMLVSSRRVEKQLTLKIDLKSPLLEMKLDDAHTRKNTRTKTVETTWTTPPLLRKWPPKQLGTARSPPVILAQPCRCREMNR